MKTPNKQEFWSIAFNHSSNVDFKDFVSPYKKFMTKSYSFLVNDTTLVSDNPSHFRGNFFRTNIKINHDNWGQNLEKQTKKKVDDLKSWNLSNEIDELNQIQSIFPQKQLNDLIIDILKEIKQLKHNMKLDDLKYTTKSYGFSKYSLLIVF